MSYVKPKKRINTPVMNIYEVSDFLRVHPSTIYRLLKTHGLPAFKIGSDWRFDQRAIEEWTQRGAAR